ncbi:MAG: HPr family phosphocarrier protein [Myxococcales bacterium]|nr:HPr family phosphocarrier protein [Myxococcales bacterium]MDD9972234.1 HPr family phosphocarrier protein [Myxococcales bacterium]
MMGEVRAIFTLRNRLGLHARAATRLSQLAGTFDAQVVVEKDGERARATSVLELLMLCGQPGAEVAVVATGNEAPQAVEAVGQLIRDRFGEE